MESTKKETAKAQKELFEYYVNSDKKKKKIKNKQTKEQTN